MSQPTFTTPTEQKAIKTHRCTWCWQAINVGDTYHRYRYFDGADAGTVKMHPECHGAMLQQAQEDGGYTEWIPGQERPATQPMKII